MRYTDTQLDFLRCEYPRLYLDDLTRAFNAEFNMEKTRSQIKNTLNNHNIKCGRQPGFPTGTLISFTREQFDFIVRSYPDMSLIETAEAFNHEFGTDKTIGQIRACIRNHRIKSGRTGCFEKGQKPWNKGKTGVTGYSSTRFKNGHMPQTYRPVGSKRLSKDGCFEIKTADPRTWTAMHKIIWIEAHGPVPNGMIIRYKDGDKGNCTLGNLELVSRSENLQLNQLKYSQQPEEIKPTVKLLAKIAVAKIDARGRNDSRNQ